MAINTDKMGFYTLKALAFERQNKGVFEIWQDLDIAAKQQALSDKYIVQALCIYAGTNLNEIGSFLGKDSIDFAFNFQEMLSNEIDRMESKNSLPQEWLEGLNSWAEGLLTYYKLPLASAALNLAQVGQPQRFPSTRQNLITTRAKLDVLLGNENKLKLAAERFALRPYLLPTRNIRPILYKQVMPTLLNQGNISQYRTLLWRGIYELYTDDLLRTWFLQQVKNTYKSNLGALLFAEAPLTMRLAFFLQMFWMNAKQSKLLSLLRVEKVLRLGSLGVLYYLNYRRPEQLHGLVIKNPERTADSILVTRAMGGLGDLLMMTPGLHALRKKNPAASIHFAIPKTFFPLLEGNDDFECIDIEDEALQTTNYAKWYDLTDCPASRIETMEFPNIKSSRIEIFASVMGVKKKELSQYGYVPRYIVSPQEKSDAEEYIAQINPDKKSLIGIQPFSAETYRNWPHIEALVNKLSRDSLVLVFNNTDFDGFNGDNLIKVIKPLRLSFAILAQCSLVISPDSAFVHLAAALSIPSIGVFGPTSGTVITRHYPKCRPIIPNKKDFHCSPCYRNENLPCKLAGNHKSVCMENIDPAVVISTIAEKSYGS